MPQMIFILNITLFKLYKVLIIRYLIKINYKLYTIVTIYIDFCFHW